ncbi:MAG: SusC/RagA family TonB-linked outer membrane protein [Lachnospirales bacterium]
MKNFYFRRILKLHTAFSPIFKRGLYVGQMLFLLFFVAFQGHAQSIKITGQVTDAFDNVPVAGATISVVGTTKATISNIDGVYELDVKKGDSLQFSFIGYDSQHVVVGNTNVINVRLSAVSEELGEVTVVAFGKQKKESVVSSISTISTKELKVPSSNLTTALSGKMAGLVSYQTTGAPGEDNAQFFVRSVTSFGSGVVEPLILIDNIEMTSDDLAKLSPDDIESFSILKDAAATALYGARGANGVVLVTTKEGKKGKAKVSFRYETSMSTPTKDVDIADPVTYMEYSNLASMTRHNQLTYAQSKIEATKDPNRNQYVYPAVDWKDMLTRNYAINQRANINVKGGGDAATYYLAGSFSQDNGILEVDPVNQFNTNIKLKRYSVRSNVNLNLTRTLEAKVRVNANFEDYTGPIGESGSGGSNTYNKALMANPVLFPAYYAPDEATQYFDRILFGNYTGGISAEGSPDYINPYADIMKGYEDVRESTFLAQLELHQDLGSITEGLRARFIGSLTRYSDFSIRRQYNPYYYQYVHGSYDPSNEQFPYKIKELNDGYDYIDYASSGKNVNSRSYGELAVLYNRTFNSVHDVGALVVGSLKSSLNGSASNLDSSLPSRNVALAGRFTYGFASRYFAEFNFGMNGSERFDAAHRWGFFPSFGLGWQVSEEAFWANMKRVISKLKVRATYGSVGNDVIISNKDRFFFTSNVDLKGDKVGGFGTNFNTGKDDENTYLSSVVIGRYANRNITWEVSYKSNVALELGLFKDKLNFMAEYYHERRTNIVQERPDVPSTMGLTTAISTNYGESVGQGIDLTLDYNNSIGSDIWYIVRGNFTYGTAEITKYDELDYSGVAPWRAKVGQKVNQQMGYIAERLFIDDKEVASSPIQQVTSAGGEYGAGDIKYRDVNEDGVVNEFDMVPMGYPSTPEIQYGFGGSFGYKNFDFSMFFQGSSRYSFFLNAKEMAPFVEVYYNYGDDVYKKGNRAMLNFIAENVWTETNRDPYAAWPRLSPDRLVDKDGKAVAAIGNNNNFVQSSFWLRTASYLRLKSVEVGYKIKAINKVGVRVYASGTNLLTFSKFDLWDPEMRGNGLKYPIQQVFNLGVQFDF